MAEWLERREVGEGGRDGGMEGGMEGGSASEGREG